jgi:hypothetical protein
MIEAANQLSLGLKQWRLSDNVLASLRCTYRDFDEVSCLLKTIAINTLYGTQIYAVIPLARHIAEVAKELPVVKWDATMVMKLAKYPESNRNNVSFAAKFCHFFVDDKRFHIYDEQARLAIRHHLGDYKNDDTDPYKAFCSNLERLRAEFSIDADSRPLDRYLWLVGSWIKWKSWKKEPEKAPINAELRALFATQPRPAALNEMLPEDLR